MINLKVSAGGAPHPACRDHIRQVRFPARSARSEHLQAWLPQPAVEVIDQRPVVPLVIRHVLTPLATTLVKGDHPAPGRIRVSGDAACRTRRLRETQGRCRFFSAFEPPSPLGIPWSKLDFGVLAAAGGERGASCVRPQARGPYVSARPERAFALPRLSIRLDGGSQPSGDSLLGCSGEYVGPVTSRGGHHDDAHTDRR